MIVVNDHELCMNLLTMHGSGTITIYYYYYVAIAIAIKEEGSGIRLLTVASACGTRFNL